MTYIGKGTIIKYDSCPNSILVLSQGRIYRRNRKHVSPLSTQTNANPVIITGCDPDTAVSSDCVAFRDDNALLSNPTRPM